MRVFCEENDELLDIEDVGSEQEAAAEAHSRCETSGVDGCRGTYRVESPNGSWVRVTVTSVVTVRYDATFEGAAPAPKLELELESGDE